MPDSSSTSTELLISAALAPSDVGRQSWLQYTDTCPLDDIPGWAMPLLPAVASNLATLDDPVEDKARLAGLRRRQWYTNQLVRSTAESAIDALRDAGIEATAHGGLAIGGLWPEPGARTLDDSRLVVSPGDGSEALHVLREAGFTTPECDVPVWHDHLLMTHLDGTRLHLSCWILGPWVTRSSRELEWRSSFEAAGPNASQLLIEILGRRLLFAPSDSLGGILWRLDAIYAIENGALEAPEFETWVARLQLGAVVRDRLKLLKTSSSGVDRSGWLEFEAWSRGATQVQHLWHHARLAEPADRPLWKGSTLRYRRHLATHERA
jgi:hypothetical protein